MTGDLLDIKALLRLGLLPLVDIINHDFSPYRDLWLFRLFRDLWPALRRYLRALSALAVLGALLGS